MIYSYFTQEIHKFVRLSRAIKQSLCLFLPKQENICMSFKCDYNLHITQEEETDV